MTGILNSILVYLIAYHVQLTISKITLRQRRDTLDVEAPAPHIASHILEPLSSTDSQSGIVADGENDYSIRDTVNVVEAPRLDRFRKHISDVSTLCTLAGDVFDSEDQKLEDGRIVNTLDHAQDHIQPSSCNLGPTRSSGASSLASQFAKVHMAVHSWMSQNVFLALSVIIFLLVGLPVSFLGGNDLFLDVGFLFTVWLTFASAQTRTKPQIGKGNHLHIRTLTAIATMLNPVLWTSLFLVAYGLAKSSIRGQPASGVAATFTTRNTISNIMGHYIEPSDPAVLRPSHLGQIPIGAGDIATSILNAGIVSWGLRLFEYRRQIVSRGGVTVIITSLLASLFNVLAWPLLVNKMGVDPASSDLSFAARSVTIALGGPAMESLGGDAGINAVGVVVNGICFQLVAGMFVGGVGLGGLKDLMAKFRCLLSHDGLVWNGVWTTKSSGGSHMTEPRSRLDAEKGRPRGNGREIRRHDGRDGNEEVRYSSDTTHVDDQRASPPPHAHEGQDIALVPVSAAHHSSNNTGSDGTEGDRRSRTEEGDDVTAGRKPDDTRTVAAGVTIGINAAAMGTAHLYEQNSHAAPYSALSMTTFGVFTVLFAVRSPLTEWLVRTVGGV